MGFYDKKDDDLPLVYRSGGLRHHRRLSYIFALLLSASLCFNFMSWLRPPPPPPVQPQPECDYRVALDELDNLCVHSSFTYFTVTHALQLRFIEMIWIP